MPEKLPYGFPDDQKYKSDDSWHRVWVNDVGRRLAEREAQGYRRYREKQGKVWAKEVRVIVGHDRTAVLMEIPQASFHGNMAAQEADNATIHDAIYGPFGTFKPQGEPIRHWWGNRKPHDRDPWSGKPVFGFLPTREWCNPWNPYRILGFPKMGEPFTALLNFTHQPGWIRLVLRYHNDRYWYVRLRWRPWKWTCELRRRETEDDRLDRKYRDVKPLMVPGVAEGEDYEIKSKW